MTLDYVLRKFAKTCVAFVALAAPTPVFAAAAQQAALAVEATIQAHPAMWTVRTDTSTAYLLGSVHILPANVMWRTPAINAAMNSADTFVFEAPMGAEGIAAVADFVRAHGLLPAGMALPSLLDAQARSDYRKALAMTDLPPEQLVNMRPWLAAIALETAYMQKQHYSPQSGVDRQIFALVCSCKKSVRYFETVEQQLSLVAPPDQNLEVEEFDAQLHQFQSEMGQLGPLVDAWASGNAAQVGKLMNKDLHAQPGARKALLDNRNDNWMVQLGPMLKEHHTYFITVGAGHMAGPHGLPALLRAQGYKVDGPQG